MDRCLECGVNVEDGESFCSDPMCFDLWNYGGLNDGHEIRKGNGKISHFSGMGESHTSGGVQGKSEVPIRGGSGGSEE